MHYRHKCIFITNYKTQKKTQVQIFITVDQAVASQIKQQSASNNSKKIGKLDTIKIKTLCAQEDNVKKEKRQITEWQKMFSSFISDETFTRVYKQLFNNKKTKTQFLKRGK